MHRHIRNIWEVNYRISSKENEGIASQALVLHALSGRRKIEGCNNSDPKCQMYI